MAMRTKNYLGDDEFMLGVVFAMVLLLGVQYLYHLV